MVIDTHVHYGIWAQLDCPLDELLVESTKAGVDKFVQVTPAPAEWDNAISIEGMRAHPDRIAGIISRFDPLAPGVEERMARHREEPGIVGIRLSTRTIGEGDGLADRAFDDFFAAAQKLDVAVQIFAPFQAPEIRETARRFPGVRILVDHMAVRHYPDRSNREMFRQWPQLLELAAEKNVWIKISYFPEAAMDVEAYPYPGAQQRLRELYEHAGPQKLIWGANYPPVKRACTYKEALDFVRVHCDFIAPGDKEDILSANFIRVFLKGKKPPSSG